MVKYIRENKSLSETIKFGWKAEKTEYNNFIDYGNNVLMLTNEDEFTIDEAIKKVNEIDNKIASACTAIVKRNKNGEVIIGRNMDLEATNSPGFISHTNTGKYSTLNISYFANSAKYTYDKLDKLDEDIDYIKVIPYMASDVFNSKGLYIEANMREPDNEIDIACKGTLKGKIPCTLASLPAIVGQSCKTVKEALELIRNDYSWKAINVKTGRKVANWNLCFVIGDTTGEYGLIEFYKDEIYYTPYANGQGNYYIHPAINQYANYGSGYGRLANALEGLENCNTEKDMFNNILKCAGKVYNQEIGSCGYSDYETSLIKRRKLSLDELKQKAKDTLAKNKNAIKKFYNGNKDDLRKAGDTWVSSLTIGYNCSTGHLILRFWEDDEVKVNVQI